jgi:hypothetical protein
VLIIAYFNGSQCVYPLVMVIIPLVMAQVYIVSRWPSFMANAKIFACCMNNAMRTMPCLDAVLTIVLVGAYRNAIVKWFTSGYTKFNKMIGQKQANVLRRVTVFKI